MKQGRMIVVLALVLLALAACAVRDDALDAQAGADAVEIAADGYVLVVLSVEDVAQVEGAVVVRGLSAGDQVEVCSESGAEVVWRVE